MGIVPYPPPPPPPPLKTLREGQIPQRHTGYYYGPGYAKSSLVRVWNEYDCIAARVSAPIWLVVWILTAGKMGRGLWTLGWSEPKPFDMPMPPTKPPAPNQIPHVVNPRRWHPKCICGWKECGGRCTAEPNNRRLSPDADMRPNGRQLRAAEKAAKHLEE